MRQSLRLRRIAQLVVAILLAAIPAAVYRASVFSQFEPLRVNLVSETLHSSRRIITITLPDLSLLRGQTAVLGLQLQNMRLEQRQVGLLHDGFQKNRVALPPHRTVRWDIVLSPELVRSLEREAGDGAQTLELTGDADGWALTALEVRNYHIRLGDRLKMLVLPGRADAYTPGTGLLPATIIFCVLALVNVLGPRSPRRSLRLIGYGVALTAFLVCLTSLLLPRLSPYRVLFSPSAFALVAAALFSPVLLNAASMLAVRMPSLFQRSTAIIGGATRHLSSVAGYWKRHPVTFERGAALLGLSAIAIAQPVFDVVSNSPEFFAARGTPAPTAVAAIGVICFGVPFLLLGIERAIRLFNARAAGVFYGVVVALLSAAVAMPLFQRAEALAPPWDVRMSALAGVAVALAAVRSRIVRQFFTALAPAAIVVPALFLLDPSVKESLLPPEWAAAVQTIERTPPIVFVIFDELPLNSLMTTDGTIDADRYPNFAGLARGAYWFRNASTVAGNTTWAMPAILSGRYPDEVNDLPTLQYFPINLFTMLAPHYSISASLRFQKLCPPRTCQDNSSTRADTVGSLVSDLGLVWLHIVLPQTLADQLPPVTEDWAEFGAARETQAGEAPDTRDGEFAQFVSSIDGQPARLHFIHSMLPHMALEYVPSGRRYRRPDHETEGFRRNRLFERASAAYADTVHQRHLAQVGFVDRLVGNLVSRLREVGAYDKALIIITSDHGASYREGRSRREAQEQNLSDLLPVPLLMKLPGQQGGEAVDRIVETVDILPTILDVLGAKASHRFDGHSLVDGRAPSRSTRTFIWRNRFNVEVRTIGDLSAERAASLERKERRFGRGDLAALYAPPEFRHLLGMDVSGQGIHPASDVRITVRNLRQFQGVNLGHDPLPLHVVGVLSTTRSEPLTVAVVVNGIVAAVTHSYRERDAHMFGTLIPETSLREGNNAVAAFVVDRDAHRAHKGGR